MDSVSVVVPAYNECPNLVPLHAEISRVMAATVACDPTSATAPDAGARAVSEATGPSLTASSPLLVSSVMIYARSVRGSSALASPLPAPWSCLVEFPKGPVRPTISVSEAWGWATRAGSS